MQLIVASMPQRVASVNREGPAATPRWPQLLIAAPATDAENLYTAMHSLAGLAAACAPWPTAPVSVSSKRLLDTHAPARKPAAAAAAAKKLKSADLSCDMTRQKFVLRMLVRLKMTRKTLARLANVGDFRVMNYWIRGKDVDLPHVAHVGDIVYAFAQNTMASLGLSPAVAPLRVVHHPTMPFPFNTPLDAHRA